MSSSGPSFRIAVLALLCAATVSACTPRLSPLYRDFEVPPEQQAQQEVYSKLRAALTDAGWQLAPSKIASVVATEPLTLSNWGLYKVTVYLEAVPVGDDHIRVYFHPFREYITGGRSKIPFLTRRARGELLPPLSRELEKQGLHPAGLPYKDDRLTAR